jgi:hypothetical protein
VKHLVLLSLLAALAVVAGCGKTDLLGPAPPSDGDTDTGTETDNDTCTMGTYQDDFIVYTAADLDALVGYTSIEGTLDIGCQDCTDLEPLACLESVGNLNVGACTHDIAENLICLETMVADLSGLDNLTTVDFSLSILCNDEIDELSALSSVTSAKSVWIYHLPALTDLDGLSGIETLEGRLWLGDNASLVALDGLGSLTEVEDIVRIGNNPLLPECEVCDLLDKLAAEPDVTQVYDNLSDTCTPVPDNCP